MTAEITIAPFTFSAADGARATHGPHPLELFTERENRAWILTLLALRAQPSSAQRRHGVAYQRVAPCNTLAEVIPVPTLRQCRDAAA